MAVSRPTSIAEAVSALAADPELCVVAGGTDVMVGVRAGVVSLTDVLSLQRVAELRGVEHDGDHVRIGAATTFTELTTGPIVTLVPALSKAARAIGSVQIRNAATIGGSLGTAAPNGDALVVLAALDARVELASSRGRRTVSAAAYASGDRAGTDELITAIDIPVRAGAQHFARVAPRAAMAPAIVNATVVTDADERAVRIALGGVAPTIVRIEAAEAWCATALDSSTPPLDRGVASEFGRRVAARLTPHDDGRATGAYRRHAAGVLATRLLLRCFA